MGRSGIGYLYSQHACEGSLAHKSPSLARADPDATFAPQGQVLDR
jgi:hypothetical protein